MTMQSEEHEGTGRATTTPWCACGATSSRSSDIGAIVLSREPSGDSSDFNRVAGVDANFRFFRSLSINGVRRAIGIAGRDDEPEFGKASIGWEDSAKRLQASIMTIGEGFRDDLGFVRRTGVTRQFYDCASFMPQPESLRRRGIRQLQPHARMWIYDDPSGELVVAHGAHRQPDHVEQRRRTWSTRSSRASRRSRGRSQSRPGVAIPAGRYDWKQHLLLFESDHSRALSGSIRYTLGDFWSGIADAPRRSACCIGRPTAWCSTSACRSATSICELPQPSFTTTLVNLRTGYSFSSNMFLDSLVQYRTDVKQFSANVRFNLIHRPLSDFFIVYNESQFTDTTQTGRPRPGREVHADVLVLGPRRPMMPGMKPLMPALVLAAAVAACNSVPQQRSASAPAAIQRGRGHHPRHAEGDAGGPHLARGRWWSNTCSASRSTRTS